MIEPNEPEKRAAAELQPQRHRRRRLLLLREAERDRASWEAPELFDDVETWIVDFDQLSGMQQLPTTLETLARHNELRPDQLYLLSPYDDAYVPAYDAETAFALRKGEIFTRLCYMLGATKVQVTRTDVDESTHTTAASVEAGRLGVGLEVSGERTLREKLAKQLSIESEFKRGPANLDAAANLLHEHALDHDSTMRGLLDLFRHGDDRVKSQNVRLNVTSEASRELKAAASLKIPGTLSVSSQMKDLRTQVQEMIVELRVTF